MKIMRGGRARWKIENETFNTLKNQGYNFEHNYGHGNQNLCTNFAILMFLAFAIDQIQKLCCNVFQKALVRRRTFNAFCQSMLSCYRMIVIENWEFLLSVIAGDIKLVAQPPP